MAFVDIGVGTAMMYGAAIGAGTGAIYAGVTGGNVLNGALMGGGIGALGGAGAAGLAGASFGGAAADMVATDVASMTASGLGEAQIAATLQASYGMSASEAAAAAAGSAGSGAGTAVQAAGAANAASKIGAAPVEAAGNAQVPTSGYQSAMNELATAPTASGGLSPYAQALGSNTQTTASNLGDYWNAIGQSGNAPVTSDAVTQALRSGAQGPTAGGGIGGVFSGIGNFVKEHPYLTAAGAGAAYLASQKNALQPNYLPAYTPQSAASMGLNGTLSANYRPTRPMAKGGIASLADGGLLQNGPAQVNFMGSDMYPQSQINRSYYATPTQMPTSAQQTAASYEPKTNPLTGELTANMATGGITAAGMTGLQSSPQQAQAQPITMDYIKSLAGQYGVTLPTQHAAKGGSMGGNYNLGSYSDGGRLLKGPGDGMSDNIPASIADKQPARLADGEFVVPADVVSHLGNGSTDAGAKHLYKMMDNVRKARTGRKSQGKQIKADKYLPK
jgi:hypothetical protein